MSPEEQHFPNPQGLAEALAEELAGVLAAAVETRGEASLVVSGGSTPLPLFTALSRRALPWETVSVGLADERWVDPSDPASNERLVRKKLLQGPAAAARFVGMKTPEDTPEAGRDACEEALKALNRPFDAVVLGMGGDGHTASLFPTAPELADGLDPASGKTCLAVHPGGSLPPRMSLTLPALLDSRHLYLHITGEEKLQVYHRALGPGTVEELPIRAVLRGAAERIQVWWAP
ncbi:MAG: 6-phosphogluconolactonase [Acidobacteriota bacterium]|nr:6-phosphogluconolactonase [Acidobacteriota bacterium]